MTPMRLPIAFALVVAACLSFFAPDALAQPGCSIESLPELALHRDRFVAATAALRRATGVAAAEAVVARWEALVALFWATHLYCERPTEAATALRRPLLGDTDPEALAALRRASEVCARVARRNHVLGSSLLLCVLGANTPGTHDGWTPTLRPGLGPFFEGTAQVSSDMFEAAQRSLAAMRRVAADRPLDAEERATVRSQRLALAAMAAAVGDAPLVHETLAPLGHDPDACVLRAELAATLGDGPGAIRTLREAAVVSPGSAAVHAALALTIWFFRQPGPTRIDPRLLGDLDRERWTPLAYDHARIALCVTSDDADARWIEGVVALVETLQSEVRGASAWGTWTTAPQPPPPLPMDYLGPRWWTMPSQVAGYEERCEALLDRRGVRARVREPWPAPR
jgi:hypothetical protein